MTATNSPLINFRIDIAGDSSECYVNYLSGGKIVHGKVKIRFEYD